MDVGDLRREGLSVKSRDFYILSLKTSRIRGALRQKVHGNNLRESLFVGFKLRR